MNETHQKEQLHLAADEGDLNKVKELIESGEDINTFDEDMSFTPLHYAVSNKHIEIVKYLLANGANVNAHEEEKIGETPLGEVAANCSYEMAEILIKAGANPTIRGWVNITALDQARDRKKEEGMRVYELLLKTAKKKFYYQA